MPVYAYRCPSGHTTEITRTPEDASRPAVCDTCGETAERQYRLGGVAFHGSGFHTTDYPRGRRLRG